MLAIVGYLIGAGVAISVVLRLAGLRYTVTPDPSFDPATVASRLVPVLGGLAGFAVTGVVLIVTQSGNASVASHGGLTTVLALFVIGYLGYFSTSLLFANVSDRGERTPFDLGAAQMSGQPSASTSLPLSAGLPCAPCSARSASRPRPTS
ncbi:MAG: hypothetical protein E6H96_07365 [Chloroflexi bacterium]|nr:MAG: hypothetical protein E6H96_07365 [Chloroflexota bacterium]